MLTYLRGSAHTIPLADESVHLVVTSPPYWSKRNYRDISAPVTTTIGGWTGQIGRELRMACETSRCGECYVCHMREVMREVMRVLNPTGSVWMNLGDAMDDYGLKMMPLEVARGLRLDGWHIKAVIPWVKPNGVPDSAPRRMAFTHEYWLWLVADERRYFYDPLAVMLPSANAEKIRAKHPNALPVRRRRTGDWTTDSLAGAADYAEAYAAHMREASRRGLVLDQDGDPLAVVFPTQGTPDAHFAAFGPRMIEPIILASSSAGGACPVCGFQYMRVTHRERTAPADEGVIASLAGDGLDRNAANLYAKNRGQRELARMLNPDETLGWIPRCRCSSEANAGPAVPCKVLDPFVGTGTVPRVAVANGRAGIGIDASDYYLRMAQARVVQEKLF